MPADIDYFLNSQSDDVLVETLEFKFYKADTGAQAGNSLCVVANINTRVYAVLEDGSSMVCDYYHVRIERGSMSTDSIDQSFQITVSASVDIRRLLDNVYFGTYKTGGQRFNGKKPNVTYRAYSYSAPHTGALRNMVVGPITMDIDSIVMDEKCCTVNASTGLMNSHKTGEVYDIQRFPMLRGLL